MPAFWVNLHTVAKKKPQSNALLGKGIDVSYASLSNTVSRVAGALAAIGICPGDRIAIVATKSLTSVVLILSALQIGAVIVPINPLLKSRQRGYVVRHSGAKAVFCSQAELIDLLADKLPALKTLVVTHGQVFTADRSRSGQSANVEIMNWADFMLQSSGLISLQCPEDITDDLGAILYTSGSTGSPKGVMITRSNLHYGALSISSYLQNTQDDRILALMPLSFDYGLSQLTSAIHSGACLVLHDYLFPKAVIDAVVEHRVTGLPAVPHLWDHLMAVKWPRTQHLRYATSTGGSLQEPTIEAIGKQLPDTTLYSMYGFTEAFRATYLPPAQLHLKPGSIGKAVPYAQVLVIDADGLETAPFEHGEIIQSGELVTAGYWNDPIGTGKKFHSRPAILDTESFTNYAWSGDMGYTDEDGYLYFVSRQDDLVKLNGHRVSPAEIEKNLIACEWLDEVCILCVPDKRFGHIVIAFVVAPGEMLQDDLTQWARRHLPNYMVPAQWHLLPELPASANNKVDRNLLLHKYESGAFSSR